MKHISLLKKALGFIVKRAFFAVFCVIILVLFLTVPEAGIFRGKLLSEDENGVKILFCGCGIPSSSDYRGHHYFFTPRGLAGEVCKASWNTSEDLLFITGRTKMIIRSRYLSDEVFKRIKQEGFVYINSKPKIPKSASNYGEFNTRGYLLGKNVEYELYPSDKNICFLSDIIKEKPECAKDFPMRHSIYFYSSKIRDLISDALNKNTDEETASLAMSILTGDTSSLEKENKNLYRASGLLHLCAVSGAHLSFLTEPFKKLFSKLPFRKNGKKIKALLLLPLIFIIVFIAGFSPSVTRAAIIAIIKTAAEVFDRKFDGLNACGFAGILAVSENKYVICDTGFILSYSAYISIILIMPVFCKLAERLPHKLQKAVRIFLPGLSVNAGMMPVMINTFNGFSVSGLFINLLAGPLARLLCMCSAITVFFELSGLPKFIKRLPAFAVTTASSLFNTSAETGEKVPFGYVTCPSLSCLAFVLYYAAIFGLIFLTEKKPKIKTAGIVSMLLCLSVICTQINPFRKSEIVYFDVGQAFSALVRMSDGTTGIIDSGDGNTDISQLLLKEGVGKLDFAILTHGHSDHSGGYEEIAEKHPCRLFIYPDNPNDSIAIQTAGLFKKSGADLMPVKGMKKIKAGKETQLLLFCYPSGKTTDLNNASVCAVISSGSRNIFFPGDVEKEEEKSIADNIRALCSDDSSVNILSVPHHGSSSSSSDFFLNTVKPSYCVISVGYGNVYGHPDKNTLKRLNKHCPDSHILRTDKQGQLRFILSQVT